MNELLQKHGCSNVFTIPEGLRELMADITREVLRAQPINICEFIANYLSALLITREHGILSVKVLEDLCDCRPSVSEHLLQLDMEQETAEKLAQVIKETIESLTPEKGEESTDKVRETEIVKQILMITSLDDNMTAKVCQIARNAYRDYWYTKQAMEKHLKKGPQEPWEIAAEHTLEIYKKTKPSYNEIMRAAKKIQSAYRGYHYRRHLLVHLKPKRHQGPKKGLLGPPLDTAASREIDLGPVMVIVAATSRDESETAIDIDSLCFSRNRTTLIVLRIPSGDHDVFIRRKLDIKTQDDVDSMLSKHTQEKLSIKYDPDMTIKNVQEDYAYLENLSEQSERTELRMISTKSLVPEMKTEGTPHQPFTRQSQGPLPYTGYKIERISDPPLTPWRFERERSQEEIAHEVTASPSTDAHHTESVISQSDDQPRIKKVISIIDKPKEFLIEATKTNMVYEASKTGEELPAEVPEDLKAQRSNLIGGFCLTRRKLGKLLRMRSDNGIRRALIHSSVFEPIASTEDESVPTVSVPTETAADDTDGDEAVDIIDDDQVEAAEYD